MEFYLLKNYEAIGYYETRLVLMAVCVVAAFYYGYYRRDERYGVVLLSGILLQMLFEGWQQVTIGLPPIQVFGVFCHLALRPCFVALPRAASQRSSPFGWPI